MLCSPCWWLLVRATLSRLSSPLPCSPSSRLSQQGAGQLELEQLGQLEQRGQLLPGPWGLGWPLPGLSSLPQLWVRIFGNNKPLDTFFLRTWDCYEHDWSWTP